MRRVGRSTDDAAGVAGPGRIFIWDNFLRRGFSRITWKNFRLQNLEVARGLFCLGRVFAGLPQNLFGLHSFCTNHFAFRFIFAYAEMGEWLTVVTHGNF
jgi:hypothetical protein